MINMASINNYHRKHYSPHPFVSHRITQRNAASLPCTAPLSLLRPQTIILPIIFLLAGSRHRCSRRQPRHGVCNGRKHWHKHWHLLRGCVTENVAAGDVWRRCVHADDGVM